MISGLRVFHVNILSSSDRLFIRQSAFCEESEKFVNRPSISCLWLYVLFLIFAIFISPGVPLARYVYPRLLPGLKSPSFCHQLLALLTFLLGHAMRYYGHLFEIFSIANLKRWFHYCSSTVHLTDEPAMVLVLGLSCRSGTFSLYLHVLFLFRGSLTHSLVDHRRWRLATADDHSTVFLLHCSLSCDISFSWM